MSALVPDWDMWFLPYPEERDNRFQRLPYPALRNIHSSYTYLGASKVAASWLPGDHIVSCHPYLV